MSTRKLEIRDYAQRDGGLFKLVHYIGYMTKEPFVAEYGKIKTEYVVPSEVVLSPLFFRGDPCQSCGKCCKDFTTTFTSSGYMDILAATEKDFDEYNLPLDYYEKLLSDIQRVQIMIKDKPVDFYAYFHPPENAKTRKCALQFNNRCGIHPVKSVTCALPHINFFYNAGHNKTYIRKQQYGRNFYLGCPTQFVNFNYEAYKTWDLYWLNKLNEVADDMGIKTFIPDVLNYLDSIDKDLKRGLIPAEGHIFRQLKGPQIIQKKLF